MVSILSFFARGMCGVAAFFNIQSAVGKSTTPACCCKSPRMWAPRDYLIYFLNLGGSVRSEELDRVHFEIKAHEISS